MVTEELQKDHKYLKRSCMNCRSLDHCSIRDALIHPTIYHCNCAKYGCRIYDGEFNDELALSVDQQTKLLREKRQIELRELVSKI